jgi:hypothetical protein
MAMYKGKSTGHGLPGKTLSFFLDVFPEFGCPENEMIIKNYRFIVSSIR